MSTSGQGMHVLSSKDPSDEPKRQPCPENDSIDDQVLEDTLRIDEILKAHAASADSETKETITPPKSSYIMRQLVGKGGHGEVWEAVQVSLGRIVAVKQLPSDVYVKGSVVARETAFRREALINSLLEHPNIIPVHDFGVDENGRPMLVMKLVRGRIWRDVIEADRAMPGSEFLSKHLRTLMDVAQAVAYAHSRGIIHRDLKPAQVMVGQYGETYLMDWGLALAFAENKGKSDSSISIPKATLCPAGTVAYMAPEQTDTTAEKLGPWTDVYLLGGILYQILTDTHPHPQKNSDAAFSAAASGDYEDPRQRAPDSYVPRELARLCEKAMSPDIPNRMSSAAEFVRELQRYLNGEERRERSLSLMREAQDILLSNPHTYDDLQQCDRLLSRALWLDGQNRDAASLHQELIAEFCRQAITRNDLALAAMLANRIGDEDQRNLLIDKVALAQSARKRYAEQRKIALSISVVLIVSILLLFVHVAQLQIRNSRAENERENTLLLEEGAQLAQAEKKLALNLGKSIELPTELFPSSTSDFSQAGMKRLLSKMLQLQAQRVRLEKLRLPIPEMPPTLHVARADLLMKTASDKLRLTKAYEAYHAAYKATMAHGYRERQELALPLAGMGVAAARGGNFTSAAAHLHMAVWNTVESSGPNPRILALYGQAVAARQALVQFVPGDLIIETRPEGKNYSHYHETEGHWLDSGTPFLAKSAAPGLTSESVCGSRKYQFTGVEKNAIPANVAARFLPEFDAPRKCYVYVTWPPAANVTPVIIRVKHAAGITERRTSQNGWNGATGNANLWFFLGEFNFAAGSDQYVELTITQEAKPALNSARGQLFADALLFAQRPLPPNEHCSLPSETMVGSEDDLQTDSFPRTQ